MATFALPTVQTKASSIEATGVVLAADEKAILTLTDVDALIVAQKACTLAGQAERAADAERDHKKLILFSKLTGVKTLDELKLLTPAEVNAKMQERAKAGLLSFDLPTTAKFLVEETHHKRPSWKDAFIAENGQLKAQEVENKTHPSYSYTVKKP